MYPVGTKLYVMGEKRGWRVYASGDRYLIAKKSYFGSYMYFIIDFELGLRGPDNLVFSKSYETQKDIDNVMNLLNDPDSGVGVSERNWRSVDLLSPETAIWKVILPNKTLGQLPCEIFRERFHSK